MLHSVPHLCRIFSLASFLILRERQIRLGLNRPLDAQIYGAALDDVGRSFHELVPGPVQSDHQLDLGVRRRDVTFFDGDEEILGLALP